MIDGDWLQKANELLSSFEGNYEATKICSENVFIVGAPRSGTTILTQALSSCFDVGYVDNLMASFWKSPLFGALLSDKLIAKRTISFSSDYGQTELISDPHEFGGFWRESLNYENMEQKVNADINWEKLTKTLDGIYSVFNKPMVYKVFQLYWHLAEFHSLRPSTKWILIERDLKSNAKSLLKLREKKSGSRDNWVSAKPQFSNRFDKCSNEIQVVSQVFGINQWIKGQFEKINPDSWLILDYEEFVREPEKTLHEISDFLGVKVNVPEYVVNGIKPSDFSETDPKILEAIEYLEKTIG